MTRGTTLIELLITLSVLGITAGIVVWPLVRFDNRVRVEAETGKLLAAYQRAQSEARALNSRVELVVTADSISIRVNRAGSSTRLWSVAGPRSVGVDLAPAHHLAAFGPNGLGVGPTNVTHVLQRGASRRQLVVSRLGRVRVVP
jgi:prepilin-type N-terminal cleavage/methylation domain-containing protein